ncbi:hypothetical protein H0H92_008545 [Tricholoma furcatifolium]|nr:hypothetical protein H0H92_008545 [Tricholoma furcatifolium]
MTAGDLHSSSAVSLARRDQDAVSKRSTESLAKEKSSDYTDDKEKQAEDPKVDVLDDEEQPGLSHKIWSKVQPLLLPALAAVILGWWISSTVLQATRHRWIVQTFWAWTFILIIAFRYIPNSVVARPVEAIWMPLVQKPWYMLPYRIRLTVGWLCLVAIVFGSAFGFKLENGTTYGDRAISILGLLIFQSGFYLSSSKRNQIPWRTVVVGLFLQQVIALFVLKTGAGFHIFNWIATLASDFLSQGTVGATFFFDAETVAKDWFFVNTLACIIFFVAFVQMMYYLGVMQWVIKNFAWLFFKLLNVSGAEAVVAAASPFIGQDVTMTSGFSTIAGSVLIAYIHLGVPAQNLVTSSVMSIPASISISKIRMPETEEPLTRGRVTVDRGEKAEDRPMLTVIQSINGLLTWIGRGFGIHQLTLELILGYVFYPVTFFLSVPRHEILRVSQLLGEKLIANEFAAYTTLQGIMKSDNPLSPRAFTIASYALCGFANLGSLGIQIGVLSALAPSRSRIIARVAVSAMICGFFSTLQTAGIVGMLV